MQIQKTQGYKQNFNGLIKFDNLTINPNHITKSKVYTSFHEMKVNRQNPYHGHYNTYLQERDVHLKGVETPRIRQWFEKHRNILKVLVNDPKDGLTIKEFDETPLQHTDKFLGFNFHELKFLNMTGKFQLLNGKTYAFENASYLIQNPTLKEINIPINKNGDRIKEEFAPLTSNMSSWEDIWSKAMKDDIVIDMNTIIKECASRIDVFG